ncbi:MAG: nucleotidyltransferase [Brachymonas sp.]|nr:nucleotidyltransferase [Brachymonas sp.]
MTALDTEFVRRCIDTLKQAQLVLSQQDLAPVTHDIYRAACIKEFEIVSEQCAKLLKKSLLVYLPSARAVDALTYKDVFRHAAKHGLMDLEAVERWLNYRDHRNQSAHEYGQSYADAILPLLPQFVADANALLLAIEAAPKE